MARRSRCRRRGRGARSSHALAGDHVKSGGQPADHRLPHRLGVRVAVHEHQRRLVGVPGTGDREGHLAAAHGDPTVRCGWHPVAMYRLDCLMDAQRRRDEGAWARRGGASGAEPASAARWLWWCRRRGGGGRRSGRQRRRPTDTPSRLHSTGGHTTTHARARSHRATSHRTRGESTAAVLGPRPGCAEPPRYRFSCTTIGDRRAVPRSPACTSRRRSSRRRCTAWPPTAGTR